MVDILSVCNLSEDGDDIGDTQLAWMPDVISQVIKADRKSDPTTDLISLLSPDRQALLTSRILLDYNQFTHYQEQRNSISPNKNLVNEYIKSNVLTYNK